MDERVKNIVEALEELAHDTTVPKNVKGKIEMVIEALGAEEDVSLQVNKALSELDEISDDSNLQAYTRTQIWNIASMLEMI